MIDFVKVSANRLVTSRTPEYKIKIQLSNKLVNIRMF